MDREPLIICSSKAFRTSDIELQKLGKTSIIENPNYITVLKRIPKYFNTSDLVMCMMLAFNYGDMKGRECERDLIEWNASATFYNMKSYAKFHNGKLPETFNDLKEWEKERASHE